MQKWNVTIEYECTETVERTDEIEVEASTEEEAIQLAQAEIYAANDDVDFIDTECEQVQDDE